MHSAIGPNKYAIQKPTYRSRNVVGITAKAATFVTLLVSVTDLDRDLGGGDIPVKNVVDVLHR
jgi:hypothetical protein